MADNSEIEQLSKELLHKEFMLEPNADYSQILILLKQELVRLMLYDSERLWNILYRIDVNEEKVKNLFTKEKPEEIAGLLAKLIIERMEQKAISRIKYRK